MGKEEGVEGAVAGVFEDWDGGALSYWCRSLRYLEIVSSFLI